MSIATILLIVILGSQAFQFDWIGSVFARGNARPNLLAIVVDRDIYEGSVKAAVIRYAKDVGQKEKDISTLIIPVEHDARVDHIAKTLEKLYFEGDDTSGARLASTLFIGDVPLPVVSSAQGVGVSILPFIDYVDKYFVYNVEQGRYIQSEKISFSKAEVGHGVLRPNTGNKDQDKLKIAEFFAKNHEYYTSQGRYQKIATQDPRVLIIDNIADTQSLSATQYALYTLRQKFREDLSYRRYTGEWSKTLSDIVNGKRSANLVSTQAEKDIQKKAIAEQINSNPDFKASIAGILGRQITQASDLSDDDMGRILLSMSPSPSQVPDIQSRTIIEKILPQWSDIFSARSISDKEEVAYKLGRYIHDDTEKLSLDSIPKLGVMSDSTANTIIKNTNDTLKIALTPFFTDLAVDAPVLQTYEHKRTSWEWNRVYSSNWFTYDNYFSGKRASEISSAQDCTIVRGTNQRVLASKGWNFSSPSQASADIATLQSQPGSGMTDSCFVGENIETKGFWGNHSLINYNGTTQWLDNKGKNILLSGFTMPVFDIAGSKKISQSEYAQYSLDPATCLNTDLIARPGYRYDYYYDGDNNFQTTNWVYYPSTTQGDRYTCQPPKTFSDTSVTNYIKYKNFVLNTTPFQYFCQRWDASLVKNNQNIWSNYNQTSCIYTYTDQDNKIQTYDYSAYLDRYKAQFKLIPSLIVFDAPNANDYNKIAQNGATPNMPIDRDHKFAFLSPALNTQEYLLPNFFRLSIEATDTRESIGAKVREYIDKKQKELDTLLATSNPSTLSSNDRTVYNTLKDQYPNASPRIFDLLFSDQKVYNSLISALYWTAQRDVDAQYTSLLKNMLDGDIKSSDPQDIFLGGVFKSPQEMALIRSQSSSSGSMTFAFAKANNEILPLSKEDEDLLKKTSRVIGVAQTQGSMDISIRPIQITSSTADEGCSPMGEAVELKDWPKAVQCWLKNETMPKITAGVCSARTVGLVDEAIYDPGVSNPDAVVVDGERVVLSSVLSDVGVRGVYEIVATRLDSDNRIILTPSTHRYAMRVSQIQDLGNSRVVYRATDSNASSILPSYVDNFNQDAFTLSRGEMVRKFAPKRPNSRYTFELFDKDTNRILTSHAIIVRASGIETSKLDTSIRSDRDLDLSSLRFYGRDGVLTDIKIDIYDALTGDQLTASPIEVNLSAIKVLSTPILKKSGSYTIVMRSSSGESAIAPLTIVPTEAKKLSLKAPSPYFASTNAFPVVLKALDDAGNPALNAGVVLDIEGATFAGGANQIEVVVSPSMTVSITPKPNAQQIKMTASLKGSTAQAVMTLVSAKDFTARWVASPSLVAGGDAITSAHIEILDESGKRVSDFQGNATISSDGVVIDESNIKFNKGLSSVIKITPRTVARRDNTLKLEIPVINLVKTIPLAVAPADPMFVYLRESNQAAVNDAVEVSLRDIYGNIVDQKSGNTLSLSLTHSYNGANPPVFESSLSASLSISEVSGLASWTLPIKNITSGTRIIVRAETSRGLDAHSYKTLDESGKEEILFGQKKSILVIARGSVISARDIESLNPSFLYGFLTGDDFGALEYRGDTSMVSALLFDREARTLGVSAYTSAGSSSSVAQFLSTGKPVITRSDAIILDTQLDGDGIPLVRILDRISRRPFIQASLSRSIDAQFELCQLGVTNIRDCQMTKVNPKSWFVYSPVTNLALSTTTLKDALTLKRDGSTIAQVYNNLRFELAPGLKVEVLSQDVSDSPFFQIAIKEGSNTLAVLTSLSAMTPGQDGGSLMHVERLESRYQITSGYVGAQTSTQFGLNISDTQVTNGVINPWPDDDLKSNWLKDIAGGLRTGESHMSKDISPFLMYFGDPMMTLPSTRQDATYDMTRGKKIYESNPDDPMVQALPFDLEGDGLDDIIVITRKGELHLLKNTKGVMSDYGLFARLPQANIATIRTIKNRAGVSHLVFINDTGRLSLYGNVGGRITPLPIDIVSTDGSVSRYDQGVQQLEVYDMDQDTRDDIVALQSDGYISVLHLRSDRIGFDQTRIDAGMRIDIQDGDDITGVAVADPRIILPPIVEGDTTSQRVRTMLYGELAPVGMDSATPALESTLGSTMSESSDAKKIPYVRGDRAPSEDLIVDKTYKGSPDLTGDDAKLFGWITVKNAADVTRSLQILDHIPKVGTPRSESYEYRIVSIDGSESAWQRKDFINISNTDYDRVTQIFSLQSGSRLEIRYELGLKKMVFKSLIVGNLDDDSFGEIAYHSSLQCGASSVIFDQTIARSYQRRFDQGTIMESPDIGFKTDIQGIVDTVKNGGNIANDPASLATIQSLSTTYNESEKKDEIAFYEHDHDSNTISVGVLSDEKIEEIGDEADDFIQQYACGYGAGGCFNTPINWAPLAPGSVPRGFGVSAPVFLETSGIPIFSYPTTAYVPIPIPVMWPGSPLGAGGVFGMAGAAYISMMRIYVTPTLTGSMGGALCFGPPVISARLNPLYPFIPAGNCIVTAKPLASCSKTGRSGNVSNLGSSTRGNQANGFFNGQACEAEVANDAKKNLKDAAQSNGYSIGVSSRSTLGDKKSLPSSFFESIQTKGKTTTGPLFSIGGLPTTGDSIGADFDPQALADFRLNEVIKIQNTRVSAFPDFIMGWVNRQLEEIQTKLTTLPTIYLILPDISSLTDLTSGQTDLAGDLAKQISSAIQETYTDLERDNARSTELPSLYSTASQGVKSFEDGIQSGISGIEATYSFLGSLPFMTIEERHIPITYPVIHDREIEVTLEEWKELYDQTKAYRDKAISIASKSRDPAALREEIAKKAAEAGYNKLTEEERFIFDSGPFISSIESNLRAIEAYKKLPEQIQKYIGWREKYAGEVLCNVEQIGEITGGFLRDNSLRFKKWVETYVLIRAILQSWQLVIDLFDSFETECGSCINERYDLKYFIIKLLSFLIPEIPVIQFWKWPDIILDIHNIRLGLTLVMPTLDINPQPLSLPRPPRIIWPSLGDLDLGSFTLRLPALPQLIPAPPELPDLPDLPSLPGVVMPKLPPPPKIPNLFALAGLADVLNILKLVSKMLCVLKNLPFVPEDKAGERIAQLTDRKGFHLLDFISLDVPHIQVTSIDAIKITSYINYQYKFSQIADQTEKLFAPLNEIGIRATQQLNTQINEVGIKNIDLSDKLDGVNEAIDKVNEETGNDIDITPEELKTTPDALKNLKDKLNLIKPVVDETMARVETVRQHTDSLSQEFLDIDEVMQANEKQLPILREIIKDPIIMAKLDTIMIELKKDLIAVRNDTSIEDELMQTHERKYELLRGYITRVQEENAAMREEIHTLHTDEDRARLVQTGDALLTRTSQKQSLREQARDTYSRFAQDVMTRETHKFLSAISPVTQATESTPRTTDPFASFVNTQAKPTSYPGLYYRSGDAQRLLTTDTDGLSRDSRVLSLRLTPDMSRQDIMYIHGDRLYLKLSKGVYNPGFDQNNENAESDIKAIMDGSVSSRSTPDILRSSTAKGKKSTISFTGDPRSYAYVLEIHDHKEDENTQKPLTALALLSSDQKPSSIGVHASIASILPASRGQAQARLTKMNHLIGGQKVTLTPGKTLYSDRETELRVRPLGGEESLITLRLGESYAVSVDTEIRVTRGAILLPTTEYEDRQIDLGDFGGYPILPGDRIYLLENTSRLSVKLTLDDGGEKQYQLSGADKRLDHIHMDVSQADMRATYDDPPILAYGSLRDLNDDGVTSRGTILLSNARPSRLESIASLSYTREVILGESSEIRFPSDILITTPIIALRSVTGDIGLIERLTLDISSRSLKIAPIEGLGEYKARISLELDGGILAPIDLIYRVKAPNPYIQNITRNPALIFGGVLPVKEGIPIDLLRYRNAGVIHLSTGTSIQTSSTGSYSFAYDDTQTNTLDISKGGSPIVRIDEYSGHITPLAGGVSTDIVSSTSDLPAHLRISYDGTPLMRLVMRRDPSSATRPIIVAPPGGVVSTGALVLEAGLRDTSILTGVTLDRAETAGVTLTGGYILYDESGNLLFALSSDYEFAALDDRISLEYDSSITTRVTLRVKDRGGKLLLTLHFPVSLYSRIY